MMSLKVLKDNRDALLLAEVAALLHDVGKLSGLFIDQQSSQPSPNSKGFEHERAVQKLNGFVDNHFLQNLQSIRLRNTLNFTLIPNNSRIGQVLDLILHHDNSNHSAFLVRLLNGCDGADSGADKGTTRSQGLPRWAKQPSSDTFIATAFGKEDSKLRIDTVRIDDIRQKLSKKVGKRLDPQVFLGKAERKRLEILRMARYAYQRALGETRRSANDVTLWDHSFSVATLYKTSLATLLLCNRLNINHLLRWRLLRVNFDVLGLYAKAIKIADLLGYQRVVDKACETVKQLVEEEYPLGNEIYRDSTGIYFTFPDLDLPADLAQEIRHRVESVEMELAPRIAVTVGDGTTATDQLKSILGKARREALEALAQPFDSQQLSACWQQQWTTVGAGQWEVCPVCRLRPMREGKEACETCMQRRMSRIKTWESDPAQTIWIDEIADHNDRVALIVGRFGLDNWLSGDLVQTMLVKAVQNNPKDCVPKNPSPARLRRVWETCQRFWTETVEREIILARHHSHGAQNPGLRCTRLLLTPDRTSGWREDVPYDGVVNGGAISLLWRKDVQQFITISNLELAGDIQPGQTIVVSEPDRPQQISFVIQR
jgi:CRISPR-associated Csx11 family protein